MDMTLIPNRDPVDIGPGSSDQNIPNPSTKPRKKAMASVYLQFFETAPDGKSRSCKFCGQSYSISTATGNLGRHLSNRHPGYDKSGDTAISSTPQPIAVIQEPTLESESEDVQFLLDINESIFQWLGFASLPSNCDSVLLPNSYKFPNPIVQLWSAKKFKAVIYEVYRSMQEDVRSSLEQVSTKISITLDFWTSYEKIQFMSITCQWIDENWSFQKVLLDICRISNPCSSGEIYYSLVKVLKMYNIENRILSCTHDNSLTAMHACHSLKEDLDNKQIGPFCYVPCAARTLNLIIDDALRTIKPIISKIREFVLELNSSLELAEDFIQLTTACQESSWKFPLDASNRWSGNYQMLDIACKAGKSMDAVIWRHEEALGRRMILSSAEKNEVSAMHQYLEPFYRTNNSICTSKLLTVGLVLIFMDHISETISAWRETRHHSDLLKSAVENMAREARNYSDQVCNVFTYMAAILDPRCKGELIPESLSSKNYQEEARTHFMKNYTTARSPSMRHGFAAQDIEDGGGVSFAEEIAWKKRRASMSNSTDELTQYLSDPPAPMPTDVLEWWKINCTRYPRLSVMARDFLAMQATAVTPEEIFCDKGDEIDQLRYCLPYHSTQALLCIRSWTQGGFMLKYESDEIDYIELMDLAVDAVKEEERITKTMISGNK